MTDTVAIPNKRADKIKITKSKKKKKKNEHKLDAVHLLSFDTWDNHTSVITATPRHLGRIGQTMTFIRQSHKSNFHAPVFAFSFPQQQTFLFSTPSLPSPPTTTTAMYNAGNRQVAFGAFLNNAVGPNKKVTENKLILENKRGISPILEVVLDWRV